MTEPEFTADLGLDPTHTCVAQVCVVLLFS